MYKVQKCCNFQSMYKVQKCCNFQFSNKFSFSSFFYRMLARPVGLARGSATFCCSRSLVFWLLGFLIVSSTERIVHAASQAADIWLFFERAGSHTKFSIVSHVRSFSISIPIHLCPWACLNLSSLTRSVASNPAFVASWRGITSKALLNA